MHEEAPAADELQAVLPEAGLVEGFKDVLNDVVLHGAPTGDA